MSRSVGQNAEFKTTSFRFNYESFITPGSVFDYDVKTHQRELKKQQPVLGGYDPKLYESKRIHATAADGTKVGISLVYKKDLKLDGKRPLVLEGYGSYGFPNDVDFSSNRLEPAGSRRDLRDHAHSRRRRPGQGMARSRQDDGQEEHLHRFHRLRRTFGQGKIHLIGSADRITGGSAGGLLMGAVTNLRPDLFKAVVSYVPFVDVMNTMLDASLPLTVGEYLEWGNPNEKAAYDYMRSYSPYENLEKKAYPTMLVRTSLNDSQVMYWEPAKYVARLRSLKTDNNLLLFKIKLEPGGQWRRFGAV